MSNQFSSQLRLMRRFRNASWWLSGLMIPGFILVALSGYERAGIAVALGFGVAAAIANMFYALARCPRCQRLAHRLQIPLIPLFFPSGTCRNCGLPLSPPRDDAA